jgi:hypothetical protein
VITKLQPPSCLSANDDGIFLLGTTNSDDGDVSELKGDDDVWFVKLGGDPLASVASVPLLAEKLKIFPNPAVGLSSVQVITVLPQPQTVRVLSMTGQVLLDARVQAFNGTLEVDLPPMPEGVYLLEVSDGTTRQLGKSNGSRSGMIRLTWMTFLSSFTPESQYLIRALECMLQGPNGFN